MSWSWSDPSQDEAIEAYEYYKSKYSDAAYKKRELERKEQCYLSEMSEAASKMDSLSFQKVNIEKRLSGIEDIIGMLEHGNVPNAIESAKSSIERTDLSFRNSINFSQNAVSLEDAFKPKNVDEDSHSASALSAFKNEKIRLEEELVNLKKQIDGLSDSISSLSNKINACNSEQASLQTTMNACAYDMNHYKKYTY